MLSKAEITPNGIDMGKEGLKAPSSTWTYLVNDSPEQFGIIPMTVASASLSIVLSTLSLAVSGWSKYRRHRKEKRTKEPKK